MRALITGVNCFVGKHLSKLLLEKGFEVFGFDIGDKTNNNIIYQKLDILDAEELKNLINKAKPEIVFHLAGFSSVKKSFEQQELCKKINVTGTKNILDAILSGKLNSKILVVSSADIYGIPKSVPIPETAELNPVSPYAESRKEQEELCKQYMGKLHIIISRSFPHIGPGQSPVFVTSDFAKQIVEIEKGSQAVIKTGNLEAKRDFTDVRDIVKAYLLAAEKCNAGEIYNICSGKAYSIKGILEKLLSLSQAEIKLEQDPERMRLNDIPILQGDNSKFIKQTGWAPEITLNQSLKDILDYWRNNF